MQGGSLLDRSAWNVPAWPQNLANRQKRGFFTDFLLADADAVFCKLVEADSLFLYGGIKGNWNVDHTEAYGCFSGCCWHVRHLAFSESMRRCV